MKKIVFAIMVMLLLSTQIFANIVTTTCYHTSGEQMGNWAEITPTIDGNIVENEWSDADTVDFTFSYDTESHDALFYVKNDHVNLYFALAVFDEDSDPEVIHINFDDDNDGNVRELGENGLLLSGDNLYWDKYSSTATGSMEEDVDEGGTNDGYGAAQFFGPGTSGDWNFEISYPLDSDDDAHDFSLSIGDTIGFDIYYFDNGRSDRWPTAPDLASLTIFGPDITAFVAAYSTNVPGIDGSLTDPEWNDANLYDISLNGAISATVYFKHDGTDIYIGFKVFDSDHDFDQFTVYFDEGDDGSYGSGTRDGVLTFDQEDLKSCSSSHTIDDGCYKDSPPPFEPSWYAYPGGDFTAECGFATDHWEVEFSIPLVGNDGGTDDVSDLACTTADTIGVKIQYFTQPGANNYYYPAGNNKQIETYATLSFESAPAPAFVAAYSTNVPGIDGSLTDPEWNDANLYDISLNGAISATVYFKHDGTDIYIGFKVFDSDHDFDQFFVYFDEGDDGSYGSGTRDGVLTSNQEDAKCCFSPAIGGNTIEDGCYKDTTWYGYYGGDFTAECGFATDHWEVEFSIPLVGNDGGTDDVSDLACTTADTIGVKIQYFTQPGANNYYYPAGNNKQIETYATLSFESATCLETDLNGDGVVNILDIAMVASAFGTTPVDPRWNPVADLDENGVINILDIAQVALDFGTICP